MPLEARVNITDGRALDSVEKVMGNGFMERVDQKYLRDIRRSAVFNASMAWDMKSFVAWQKRHGIDMEEEPSEIFEQYLDSDHAIFMSLLEHPQVEDPDQYARCSIILQRAAIFFANGREDLFIRSYFHSAKSAEEYENFVPSGAVHMSFPTDEIWFPLELTRAITEPTSEVVLDILTPKGLDARQLPEPFKLQRRGRMTYGVERYEIARIGASLAAKKRAPDLRIGAQAKAMK